MKKIKIILFIFIIFIFIIMLFFYYKHLNDFDINNSIGHYNLDDENICHEYIKYLKSQMNPKQIVNFVDDNEIILSFYNKNATGKNIILQMKQIGYKNVFNYIFNNDNYDISKIPITKNFIDKYKVGLKNYFSFAKTFDIYCECTVDINDNTLVVHEMSNFYIGEPLSEKYHHYHYELDDNGNIDAIVHNYDE